MMKTVFLLLSLYASASAFTAPLSTVKRATFVPPTVLSMAEDGEGPSVLQRVTNLGRRVVGMPVLEKEATTEVAKAEEAALEAVEITDMPITAEEMMVADEPEEELSETQKLMQQVKDAGLAGVISYALWELGFWAISVPVCVFGYREVTGHWPDFNNQEDMQKLGAEAFAFVNFARFAVPLRIGLALGTTPWIQENIVDQFISKEEDGDSTESP